MRIAAIGGGNKQPILDQFIADLPNDKAVIIPTACSTRRSFDKKVSATESMLADLGLATHVLHEFEEKPTQTAIEHELGRASIAYVIGGNSPHMLETMALHSTDLALTRAVRNGGISRAGTSAGALLPFARFMSCPAKQPQDEVWNYEYLQGLSLIPASATAHANKHDEHKTGAIVGTRYDNFALPESTSIGFAIENDAALVIDGERSYVGRATPEANVHLISRGGVPFAIRDNDLLSAVVRNLYTKRTVTDGWLLPKTAAVPCSGEFL